MEIFNSRDFKDLGMDRVFVQDNHSTLAIVLGWKYYPFRKGYEVIDF